MGRTPCCITEGIRKGAWTSDEDEKLSAYIEKHGEGGWRTLPDQKAGLRRCGRSCRLRWTNYLRPDIRRGEFSAEEEQKIIELHATLGNRWSAIAKQLAKRTDNEIKNYWNTHLKKRLTETTDGSSNSTGRHNHQNGYGNNNTNNSSQGDPTNMFFRNEPCNVMPRSASVVLLNRLATKLPSSHFLDALKDGPLIYSPTTCKDASISDASSGSDYKPSLSSARLVLNKMARSIKRPTICLDMVKSILSKTSNGGTDTSIGDGIFHTSASNVQTCIPPCTSLSIEAAENVDTDIMRHNVSSHGGIPNDHNGNGSVRSLTEDFDLDFLQDWTTMDDDDDSAIGILGRGSNEGGVSSASNGDSHNIEYPMSPLIFVNDFEPEPSISWELSDFMDFH